MGPLEIVYVGDRMTQNYYFCFQEQDYDSKKEILFTPSRFLIFGWRHQFSGPRQQLNKIKQKFVTQ